MRVMQNITNLRKSGKVLKINDNYTQVLYLMEPKSHFFHSESVTAQYRNLFIFLFRLTAYMYIDRVAYIDRLALLRLVPRLSTEHGSLNV